MESNIETFEDLKLAIDKLEDRQRIEEKDLRDQFHEAYESIRPINLIKNSLQEATENIDVNKTVLNSSIGLGAGLLSKIIFRGLKNQPVKKLIGSAIVYGITNYAAKHPETVKSVGSAFINLFKSKTAKTPKTERSSY